MIKYSFREDENYVAIKEHEYDDLMKTNEDACRTYQEIFHSMDEGWVVTIGVGRVIDKNIDMDFSVVAVSENIRPRNNDVDWFHVVWFSQQIPLHSIILWLVIKRKLKTQDSLRQWDVSTNTNLTLLLCIANFPSGLTSIVDFLILMAKMRLARCVIAKLIFAASCYFIWQERNERLFSKKKRSCDQLIDLIKTNVRLKLLTYKFKKTSNVQMLFQIWKLPNLLLRSSRH
ncbi:zinc knuckle CX2CX4HX4C containing protein [Tanacetum coccineum]